MDLASNDNEWNMHSKASRVAELVQLVQFWADRFSKEDQNIFQLTKNQMHG